jgi:hypothetical protein
MGTLDAVIFMAKSFSRERLMDYARPSSNPFGDEGFAISVKKMTTRITSSCYAGETIISQIR